MWNSADEIISGVEFACYVYTEKQGYRRPCLRIYLIHVLLILLCDILTYQNSRVLMVEFWETIFNDRRNMFGISKDIMHFACFILGCCVILVFTYHIIPIKDHFLIIAFHRVISRQPLLLQWRKLWRICFFDYREDYCFFHYVYIYQND